MRIPDMTQLKKIENTTPITTVIINKVSLF